MKKTVENYTMAEHYLSEVPKFTKKNPLEETKGFYQYIQSFDGGKFAEGRLGKIIHVAGTNGKGSVCAFLQSIFREGGYRTGMFVSPHLVTTRERFCIDGNMISEAEFVRAYDWLDARLAEYRRRQPGYSPTYFERLFFMGIYVFAGAGVDVTILETGLGGRLDTTNVVKNPVMTIITEVGFDHMEYLGDTLEKIASEKAGIVKTGIPVVFSDRKKEVTAVIREKAAACGCKCFPVSENDYKINEIQKKFIDFSVNSLYYDYGRLMAGTTAAYQAENGAVAIRACEILKNDLGFEKITVKSIKDGIRYMSWPGRMEEIRPGVYIDGAHNEDGIRAFVQSLEASACGQCVIVFSVVKDKQYDKMIELLCGLHMVSEIIITHIPGERGAGLTELKNLFDIYAEKSGRKAPVKVSVRENIEDAAASGMEAKGDTGCLYIVGSLYLAGCVKKYCEKDRKEFL